MFASVRNASCGLTLLFNPENTMFDSTHLHVRSSPSHVSVTEHRAPTDDSIRLAEEMREKILKSIQSESELFSNTFSCSWIYITDPANYRGELRCRFLLNDIPEEIVIPLCQSEMMMGGEARFRDKIREAIIHRLTALIGRELFASSVLRHLRPASNPTLP